MCTVGWWEINLPSPDTQWCFHKEVPLTPFRVGSGLILPLSLLARLMDSRKLFLFWIFESTQLFSKSRLKQKTPSRGSCVNVGRGTTRITRCSSVVPLCGSTESYSTESRAVWMYAQRECLWLPGIFWIVFRSVVNNFYVPSRSSYSPLFQEKWN